MGVLDLATTSPTLSSALSQLYAPRVINAFNRLSVLAALLPKKMGSGKNVAWDVFVANGSAETFTDGQDVSTYNSDYALPAVLSWGLYRANFSVTELAQAAAATSSGSALELLDLMNTQADQAAMKIAAKVNADLFNGTTNIIGLDTAIGLATGTYAGIDKGTYTGWAPTVSANGSVDRPLTKAIMDAHEAAIYTACGEMPDLIIASPTVCSKYEALFDSVTRVALVNSDLSAASAPGVGMNKVMPSHSGWTGLFYKGVPVYRDRNATDEYMYFLNTNYLSLEFLPHPSVNTAAISKSVELKGLPNSNMAGLAARIDAMAKTGQADKFSATCMLALKCSRPSAMGVIKDIDT
jgi:hypothetical protein